MIETNLDKSCDICDFENTCLDEPADANNCDGFRNLDIFQMENALTIIADSKWLLDHDEALKEKVLCDFLADLYSELSKGMPSELNGDARYGYACALSMILEKIRRVKHD